MNSLFRATLALALVPIAVPHGLGQNWLPTSAPNLQWQSLACSADGKRLVAAGYQLDGNGTFVSGLIYISTNSGAMWMPADVPSEYWRVVASSTDGRTLAAASFDGWNYFHIYVSTNSGWTWTVYSPQPNALWSGLAVSADGSKLAAVFFNYPAGIGGSIFVSTNTGGSWTDTRQWGYFRSIAASADGVRLAAASCYVTSHGSVNQLLTSTNVGAYWTVNNGSICAESICSSSDGTRLIAAGDVIYMSIDSGSTWNPTSTPGINFDTVACSTDGTRIVAAAKGYPEANFPGQIFTSADSGITWVSNAVPSQSWQSVASSADGCRTFAAVYGGLIYKFEAVPAPVLRILSFSNSILLSWIVPSSEFALQETGDLITANWTDVPVPPTLNYTNITWEVALPVSVINKFYRLAAR